MDKEIQFPSQTPEIAQHAQEIGHQIGHVLSSLDLVYEAEQYRRKADGSIEVYPYHETHEDKPPLTEKEKQVAHNISSYLHEAVSTLTESTESDELWDAVFEAQVTDFSSAIEEERSQEEIDTIGLSILSANLITTADLSEEQRNVLLDRRFWRIAKSEHGKKLLDIANKNIGFCVAISEVEIMEDEKRTVYRSIATDIQRFSSIVTLTDKDNTGDDYPTFEPLKTATLEDTTWLVQTLIKQGRSRNVLDSFTDMNPQYKRTVADELVSLGWNPNIFGPSLYSQDKNHVVYSALECIAFTQNSDTPEGCLRYIELLDPSEINDGLALITDVTLLSEAIQSLAFRQVRTVDTKFLPMLLEAGMHPRLNAFSNLRTEDIQLIQSSNLYKEHEVLLAAGSMGPECQRWFLQSLFERKPSRANQVASSPELFTSVSVDELLTMFMQYKPETVSSVIGDSAIRYWLPSFDKERISKLLEVFPSEHADIISTALMYLGEGALEEKRWLFEATAERSSTFALQLSLRAFKDVMSAEEQMNLLDRIIDPASFNYLTESTLSLLDKIPASTLFEKLYTAGKLVNIIENFEFFASNIDRAELIGRLSATTEGLVAIAESEALVREIGPSRIFDALKSAGNSDGIFSNVPLFVESGIPLDNILELAAESELNVYWLFKTPGNDTLLEEYGYDKILDKFSRTGKSYLLVHALEEFPSESDQLQIITSAITNGKSIYEIVSAIDGLPEVPQYIDQVRQQLIERGENELIYRYPQLFFGGKGSGSFGEWRTSDDIHTLIEKGAATAVVMHPQSFRPSDVRLALSQALAEGNIDIVAKNFLSAEHFLGNEPLDQSISLTFAKSGYVDVLLRFATIMGTPTKEHVDACYGLGTSKARDYYDHFKETTGATIDWVETGYRLLGKDAPISAIHASKEITSATTTELPEHFQQLGITKKGMQGIEQLRAAIPKICGIFIGALEGTATDEQLLLLRDNPIAKGYGKFLVRFSESDFGKHSDEEWERIIDVSRALSDAQLELPTSFKPSELTNMDTRDEAELMNIAIRPDVRDRFTALQDDIRYVLDLIEHRANGGVLVPSNEIKEQIVSLLRKEQQGLQLQLENTMLPEKARQGITLRITELEQALSDKLSPSTLLSMANKFGGIKIVSEQNPEAKKQSTDHVFRKLALALAIENDTSAVLHNAITLKNADATIDNIAFMQEFIDESVQGRLKSRFSGDEKAFEQSFKKLLSTVAFREQMTELSKIGFNATSTLQLFPGRGLMLELSGHFSDACWASRYESITEANPGVSAIVMVKNRGQASERIVGSSLIIETVDQSSGEPILVIRGLNPIQNYVTAVDTEKFLDTFLDYVQTISAGKRIGIVLDKSSGGALTNRPGLHTAITQRLSAIKDTQQPITLPESSTFNDYRLTLEQGYPVYYIS